MSDDSPRVEMVGRCQPCDQTDLLVRLRELQRSIDDLRHGQSGIMTTIRTQDQRDEIIERKLNRRLLITAGILLAVVVGGENALKYLPALVAGASEPGPAEIAADPGVPYLPEATP